MSEPRTATDIAEALFTDGTMPSPEEVYALCQDVIAGHHALDAYEALVLALRDNGWDVINTTTDDDETTRLEIVHVDPDMPPPRQSEKSAPRV